jgi:putative spermidine/putrescine transport system substrate-binding protein
MMSSHAPDPNCMLMWMQYTLQADVQTEAAEFYGATPSNSASCAQLNKDFGSAAKAYHCGDDAFLSSVALWKTPLADCGNGSQDCMDYAAWQAKWLEVRGG